MGGIITYSTMASPESNPTTSHPAQFYRAGQEIPKSICCKEVPSTDLSSSMQIIIASRSRPFTTRLVD